MAELGNEILQYSRKVSSDKIPGSPEDPTQYREGGYHPVEINDILKNRYRVIKKLGWGISSTVWLCWDSEQKREVAVKIVKSARNYTEAALHEINFLKSVQSSDSNDFRRNKIVQYLNNFEIQGVNGTHVCIVLEAVSHVDLTTLIIQNPRGIPLNTAKCIIAQVLQSLDYLHTKCQIIHTDIKPENVLVRMDEENKNKNLSSNIDVKIVDFGSSIWIHEHLEGVLQTRPYRSLEVILGIDYSTPIDIWSTACMAFELVTGDFLFLPSPGEGYSEDKNHVARIIQLLGTIPPQIAMSGKYSPKFFTEMGEFHSARELENIDLYNLLTQKYEIPPSEAKTFESFLIFMLRYDPKKRATAAECLSHRWLQGMV